MYPDRVPALPHVELPSKSLYFKVSVFPARLHIEVVLVGSYTLRLRTEVVLVGGLSVVLVGGEKDEERYTAS